MNVRPLTEDDFPTALELGRAADIAVCGDSDWTETGLREELDDIELATDSWLFEDGDGALGWAYLRRHSDGKWVVEGYVHPERTRRGVGSAIVERTESRLRERLDDGASVRLQNATLNADAETNAFYVARGYEEVRHFLRMVADLEEAPDPEVPEGIEIRLYREPAERRAVWSVLQEAFLDHWDNTPRTFEEWSKRGFERAGFDPTLVWLALAGDQVVGANHCSWKQNGDWGWVGTIGVRRDWRGRGIGEALLRTAFAEFFRRGERRVALGVDAQSTTGATRLYERVGMKIFWDAVVWEKEVSGS